MSNDRSAALGCLGLALIGLAVHHMRLGAHWIALKHDAESFGRMSGASMAWAQHIDEYLERDRREREAAAVVDEVSSARARKGVAS